ncbi:MAG TPA: PAS domain-containing protein, partial [Pseudomonadales bacterium]|nr:PAS domain-containing protein [Pseudomonadales bacterium]
MANWFNHFSSLYSAFENKSKLAALNQVQAVIEFELDGRIISANQNFLSLMGYSLSEIQGRHHSIFVDPVEVKSNEYAQFWSALNLGESRTAEFKRLAKGGKEVWIQASYMPLLNAFGKPYKVVKFAIDVTSQKLMNADFSGQMSAISRSQAVIEFNLDGTIIHANDNFLHVMGYGLGEVKGRHHSMFVDPAYAGSPEYLDFWARLNRGEFQIGEFKRLGKGNREVWIQASYNPIYDLNGKPCKVVKYASDITDVKIKSADYAGQISAIGKSQAVIEFNMDGTIISANEKFLTALGYRLD